MKKILLLTVLLGLASCKSSNKTAQPAPESNEAAPETNEDKFVIENLTKFDAEELKKNFPEANIKEDVGMFEEGTEERAYSILYPDTPNEIHITWADKDRTKINDIRFSEGGNWKSASGIKIGTTYEELNELNGKPISFYGFGWDYSGAVMWNDGKFEDSNLRIFLAPKSSPAGKFYGDHIIKASPEEIAALDLTVQTIIYKM